MGAGVGFSEATGTRPQLLGVLYVDIALHGCVPANEPSPPIGAAVLAAPSAAAVGGGNVLVGTCVAVGHVLTVSAVPVVAAPPVTTFLTVVPLVAVLLPELVAVAACPVEVPVTPLLSIRDIPNGDTWICAAALLSEKGRGYGQTKKP